MEVVLIAEDALGEALMRRLVHEVGKIKIYRAPPMGGVSPIRTSMEKFIGASNVMPHIVFTDLDRHKCVSQFFESWGFNPVLYPNLLFRVAVREAESWLLADRNGLASFFQIPSIKVPLLPEDLMNPKRTLVNLARGSRSRRFRAEMTPVAGSAAQVGPLYNSHLTNFVRDTWDLLEACHSAPSLAKAVKRLGEFRRSYGE